MTSGDRTVDYRWRPKFFGGYVVEETSNQNGISEGTIKRHFPNWESCQMYLAQQITDATNSQLAELFEGQSNG